MQLYNYLNVSKSTDIGVIIIEPLLYQDCNFAIYGLYRIIT